jgi:hypothetical protein
MKRTPCVRAAGLLMAAEPVPEVRVRPVKDIIG